MDSMTDPMPTVEGWYLVEMHPRCYQRAVYGRPFAVYRCKKRRAIDGKMYMQWIGILDLNIVAWHPLPDVQLTSESDFKHGIYGPNHL